MKNVNELKALSTTEGLSTIFIQSKLTTIYIMKRHYEIVKNSSVTIAKPVLTYNIHLYSPSFVTKSTNISYMNYLLVMYYKIIS